LRPTRTRVIPLRTWAIAACKREERFRAGPWLNSTGASSTIASRATGATAAITSAFWWPLNRSTEENMMLPRIASARMLISVCETSVPSTIGRFSRGRPVRRATTSAREGSPRRAGSVEDMSTPMNVPCMASANRIDPRGSAARRMAFQEKPRMTIAEHITASPIRMNVGLELMRAAAMCVSPIF
jgi:hypothetical protein